MRNREKQVIEALQRVQDFLRDNPLPGGATYGPGQALLDEVLADLGEHRRDQTSGQRLGTEARGREGQLRDMLREVHLRPLSLMARASMRGKPGIQKALRTPKDSLSTTKLIAEAEGIRKAVAEYEAEFLALGCNAGFLAELDEAIAMLEGTLRGKAKLLGRKAGASEGLAEGVTRGGEALKLLDARVLKAFRGKPDVLARWRIARRVRALPSGGVQATGGTADENLAPAA